MVGKGGEGRVEGGLGPLVAGIHRRFKGAGPRRALFAVLSGGAADVLGNRVIQSPVVCPGDVSGCVHAGAEGGAGCTVAAPGSLDAAVITPACIYRVPNINIIGCGGPHSVGFARLRTRNGCLKRGKCVVVTRNDKAQAVAPVEGARLRLGLHLSCGGKGGGGAV